MKKLHILGLAVMAVCALTALAASSASATVTFLLAEWLFKGAAVTGTLPVTAEGALVLSDLKAPIVGEASVLCEGILDGWVDANGLDFISEVLSLAGAAISNTPLSGTGLACTSVKGCEGTDAKVWPVNMGWETLLELAEGTPLPETEIVILFHSANGAKTVGWYVECLVLGLAIEDTCTSTEAAALAKSVAAGVEATFSETLNLNLGIPFANCTQGGEGSGLAESQGTSLIKDTEAGVLSVSSEGVTF